MRPADHIASGVAKPLFAFRKAPTASTRNSSSNANAPPVAAIRATAIRNDGARERGAAISTQRRMRRACEA